MQRFLYGNAGFGKLRAVEGLDDEPWRFDVSEPHISYREAPPARSRARGTSATSTAQLTSRFPVAPAHRHPPLRHPIHNSAPAHLLTVPPHPATRRHARPLRLLRRLPRAVQVRRGHATASRRRPAAAHPARRRGTVGLLARLAGDPRRRGARRRKGVHRTVGGGQAAGGAGWRALRCEVGL